jgi:hypothetical protein
LRLTLMDARSRLYPPWRSRSRSRPGGGVSVSPPGFYLNVRTSTAPTAAQRTAPSRPARADPAARGHLLPVCTFGSTVRNAVQREAFSQRVATRSFRWLRRMVISGRCSAHW